MGRQESRRPRTGRAVYSLGTCCGTLAVAAGRGEPPFARIPIVPGGEWHASAAVSFPPLSGTHALYFTYTGGGAMDFRDFTLGKL